MAQKPDYFQRFNDLIQYVPQNLRNPAVKGLIDNLFNRFLTKDESIPLYGYIGDRPSNLDDTTPRVPELSTERDLNALIPVLNFDLGTTRYAFTAQDLLQKAKVLGISSETLDWLYTRAQNYLPPIDIEKFAKFYNFFWTGKANPPTVIPSWNTELLPEYYTIAKPALSSLTKLNVRTATTSQITLSGTGFYDQTYLIQFSSSDSGTITSISSLGSYGPSVQPFTLSPLPTPTGTQTTGTSVIDVLEFNVSNGGPAVQLLKFEIIRDPVYDAAGAWVSQASFDAGDGFTLITLLNSTGYSATFAGSSGVKGKISGVQNYSVYQTVGGVQVADGDRILVKNNSPAQDGIWIVRPQAWVRALDFNAETAVPGAQVWVREGTNARNLYESIAGGGWIQIASDVDSNTNDWQEDNFWIHVDELSSLGISRSAAIQATRPIIEYSSDLQLNEHSVNGVPSNGPSGYYRQSKFEFNQLPFFDLFRYDGTHAGKVSSIFYYVQDLTAPLDVALQKRVKISSNDSADFIFDHGLEDDDGDQLFYKSNDQLKSIWHPGYGEPTIVDTAFIGRSKGAITNIVLGISPTVQTWTLTATSSSSFTISGSVTGTELQQITVGVPFSISELSITVTSGLIPFDVGDEFTFDVLVGSETSSPIFSGAQKGTISVSSINAATQQQVWLFTAVSSTEFEVTGSKYGVIPEPDSILTVGSLYTNADLSCIITAGSIAFDAGDTFLFRLGNIETPRYITRSSNGKIQDFYGGVLADTDGVGAYQVPRSLSYNPFNKNRTEIPEGTLYAHFQSILGNQLEGKPNDYAFGGSIKNWSEQHSLLASLLMQRDNTPISIVDLAERQYRTALNAVVDKFRRDILQYFTTFGVIDLDGSLTQAERINDLLNTILAGRSLDNDVRTVLYDSTSPVAGFPATLPQLGVLPLVQPAIVPNYTLNQIMLRHHDGHQSSLFIDDYDFRSSILGDDGLAKVFRSDGTEESAVQSMSATPPVNPYRGTLWIRPNGIQREILAFDVTFDSTPENQQIGDTWYNRSTQELSIWNGSSWVLQPSALVAYKTVNLANVLNELLLLVELRLYEGINPNSRKIDLASLFTAPAFNEQLRRELFTYAALHSFDPLGSDYVAANAFTWNYRQATYIGSMPIGETPARWFRVLTAHQSTIVGVIPTERPDLEPWKLLGFQTKDDWFSTLTPAEELLYTGTGGLTWSVDLWNDIIASRPGLRISVYPATGELLPPYVAPSANGASYALTNTIPVGISSPYAFGESSPIETFWVSTLEYGYSLARALFRYDPMMFLGFCWGFNWVSVDGLSYDGFNVSTPSHLKFKLHGEQITPRDRTAEAIQFSSIVNTDPIDILIQYDAYEVLGGVQLQNFSIRDTNTNLQLGYVRANTAAITVTTSTFTINDLRIFDFGKTYRIGDTFRIVADSNGTNLQVQFTPEPSYLYLGFGQTFTHALRELSIDTQSSFAVKAFRDWDVDIGYRAGGLVSTDDLKVRTENNTLSPSSYSLIIKKNAIADDIWIQGLRVSVLQFGTSKEIDTDVFVPSSDGADWVFRIEGYNPRYSVITYNTYDSIDPITFRARGGEHTNLIWTHPVNVIGTVTTSLPITITGIQNVVNFLFGYWEYLTARGVEFNATDAAFIDAETTLPRSWQLEIEKFIDNCYVGLQLGQGAIINTFQDKIWIKQETGLLSEFVDTALFDITANPAVFDALGIKISAEDLYVIRGNKRSEISAEAPMYSVHAQIDDYEHLFIFNKFVEDSTKNDILYEPFSGARVPTYRFNGRRQASTTFRPEYGGHYIVNNSVRQNLQASTDNIQNFFDANRAFENDLTTRHALSLLGFNTKSYFNDLNITNGSQFNFWRGLIQAKGTNKSIDAYLNSNRFEDAKIDEFWAYKLAEYGDARQRSYPELKLSVKDTQQQFTKLQFNGLSPLQNFTQISSSDESRWFSLDDLDDVQNPIEFLAEVSGVYSVDVDGVKFNIGDVLSIPFVSDRLVIVGSGTQINARTVRIDGLGALTITGYLAAANRYTPLKLVNYVANEVIQEIPLWHPAAGYHTPAALENINVIGETNPARYNYSTLVKNNNAYDPLRTWGDAEIGRVWFDTSNLVYVPYYDAIPYELNERLSRWGALADHSTIDVYEWVKSSVPPSEYNDLAQQQAGNADLDPTKKAAGEVALQETYSRDRIWSIRPIAWSKAGVPSQSIHPVMKGGTAELYLDVADHYSLSDGAFEDYGIVVGDRIGEFDSTVGFEKPVSEATILSFEAQILRNNVIVTAPITSTAGLSSSIKLTSIEHKSVTGPFRFSSITPVIIRRLDGTGAAFDVWDVSLSFRITEIDSGQYEDIPLGTYIGLDPLQPTLLYGATIEHRAGDVLSYTSELFGLKISVIVDADGVSAADEVLSAIVGTLGTSISIRDTAVVSTLIPSAETILSNLTGPTQQWRAWTIPTQAELTADSKQPVSIWKPYLGDYVTLSTISGDELQSAIQYEKSKFILNNGFIVERYKTSWGEWQVLKDVKFSKTALVQNEIITHPTLEFFDVERTSVYVNGVNQLQATFVIDADQITPTSRVGDYVTVVVRRYEPSSEQLSFDPAVQDDLTFQTQYKRDYQYVVQQVRDSSGSLSSSAYYFWVKNKSTPAAKKRLSLQSIKQLLRDGPTNYITFQNIFGDGTIGSPFKYDSLTISNLGYLVEQDGTFKLRFLRDFTLRDDPENLNLKNVHTEWSLIRTGQRTRIPEKLWMKLVDSMAGEDSAGNTIPSLRRSLYDERNGTQSQFGFGAEQTLAPANILISSVQNAIVNTTLIDTTGSTPTADFIAVLDFSAQDTWFESPAQVRQTMTKIWTGAKPAQINEIFFAALNDLLAANLQISDIFKTSRLSAYSIRVVTETPAALTYE